MKNSNEDIKNENRILEVEISNYKSQEKNKKNKISSNFNENLLNFINSLKQALKYSTKKNTEIVDKIFEFQKNIKDIINKNKKKYKQKKK